jgi:hypothetical protein
MQPSLVVLRETRRRGIHMQYLVLVVVKQSQIKDNSLQYPTNTKDIVNIRFVSFNQTMC